MAKWLTSTITHSIGSVDRSVHSPDSAETYDGTVRRLRDAGRDFTHGPGWIEYSGDHYGLGESWKSDTRLEWSDAQPASD